jgi:hypothetical protein
MTGLDHHHLVEIGAETETWIGTVGVIRIASVRGRIGTHRRPEAVNRGDFRTGVTTLLPGAALFGAIWYATDGGHDLQSGGNAPRSAGEHHCQEVEAARTDLLGHRADGRSDTRASAGPQPGTRIYPQQSTPGLNRDVLRLDLDLGLEPGTALLSGRGIIPPVIGAHFQGKHQGPLYATTTRRRPSLRLAVLQLSAHLPRGQLLVGHTQTLLTHLRLVPPGLTSPAPTPPIRLLGPEATSVLPGVAMPHEVDAEAGRSPRHDT